MVICSECGQHTRYTEDNCQNTTCGKALHEKNCTKEVGKCHCHEKNQDIWNKKQKMTTPESRAKEERDKTIAEGDPDGKK